MEFKSIRTTLALTTLLAGTPTIAMNIDPYEDSKDKTSPPMQKQGGEENDVSTPLAVISNQQVPSDTAQVENGSTSVPPSVVNKTLPETTPEDSWPDYIYKAFWNTPLKKKDETPPAPTPLVIEKNEEKTISVITSTTSESTENFSVEELTKSVLDLNLVNKLLDTAKDNVETQELAKKILKKAEENRKNKQPISTAPMSKTDEQQLSLFWRMLGYK